MKRALGRIWHFIETADNVEMTDASDRIREHRDRQERLEDLAAEARAILSQRRADLDDVEAIAAYAQDMSEFSEGERADRAQGLHRNLRQGDRRDVRRRPTALHRAYAGRQFFSRAGH